MPIAEITGLVCGALALYVLVGYPVLLMVWCWLRPRPWIRDFHPLAVTALLPVHNGERWLAAKLEALLGLDYPAEKLRILVLSDGSTDGTADIARSYAARGVELLELPKGGKSAALTVGLERATGEAVLMVDVRQDLSFDSLRNLVAGLGDPTVGVVSGELILRDGEGREKQNVGLYWTYEKFIRRRQALLDSVPGATGALYVMRRELARALPSDLLLDDVYLPVGAVRHGYRVVFEETALAYDDTATLSAEFGRKVRTQAGLWQLLWKEPWLLGPGNRIWIHFVSHKLGRLLLPFALAGLFVASLWMAEPGRTPLLATQSLFYGLAYADRWIGDESPLKRFSGPARTMIVLLLAAVVGLRVYWTPAQQLWQPTGTTKLK